MWSLEENWQKKTSSAHGNEYDVIVGAVKFDLAFDGRYNRIARWLSAPGPDVGAFPATFYGY